MACFLSDKEMETLFPVERNMPEGFDYFPGFVSEEEEDGLMQIVAGEPLHTFIFQGYEAKRKVASYGHDWNFTERTLSKGKEIPESLAPLMARVAAYVSLNVIDFAEVLFTEYPVGAVINWHRDAPPFDLIAGISLLSDCTFRFRPHDKEKQGRGSIISLPVRRRSLYVMQGPARNEWQHSILPVKEMRYSITLRTLKQ